MTINNIFSWVFRNYMYFCSAGNWEWGWAYFYLDKLDLWKTQWTSCFYISDTAPFWRKERKGLIFKRKASQYGLERPRFATDHIVQSFKWEQACTSLNLNKIWLNIPFLLLLTKQTDIWRGIYFLFFNGKKKAFTYQSKNVKRNQTKYSCCHSNTRIAKKCLAL